MSNTAFHPRPGVSAVIANEGSVLLVRRGSEPYKGLWSLPGGSIDPGETVREALAREVFEETSLEVEVGDVVGVQDVVLADGDHVRFHYVLIVLRASVISGDLEAGSDAAEARWVKLHDVSSYATTPELAQRLKEAGLSL